MASRGADGALAENLVRAGHAAGSYSWRMPPSRSPLPSYVWHEDMADFAELVSDDQAAGRLSRAINGRGAFRRFKDELHEEYPHLLPAWYAFRDARAARRAVDWLLDASLISHDAADRFRAEHPEPAVP